jgi:hypothetical protein
MRASEARFTDLQGQYLALIEAYTTLHGIPPAEADMQRFFRVTPTQRFSRAKRRRGASTSGRDRGQLGGEGGE